MPFTDPIVPNPLPTAFALISNSANTLYENALDLAAGVYTITFTMGGTVSVDFYSGNTYIGNFTGTTGQQYNLATAATNIKYWTSNSGVFVLTLSALLPPAPISGTLYTYTTSQTITLIGDGYCVVVGGGDRGDGGFGISGTGAGGGSGGITGGRITLTGSLALTVGGIAGTTTLGSYTATGASGATGGSPNGVNGLAANPGASTVSAATATGFPFITVGTTGAGGSGAGKQGGGSGIGTGGAGIYPGTGYGNPGTGYGAGGGGGAGAGGPGGAGTAGVCYIVV